VAVSARRLGWVLEGTIASQPVFHGGWAVEWDFIGFEALAPTQLWWHLCCSGCAVARKHVLMLATMETHTSIWLGRLFVPYAICDCVRTLIESMVMNLYCPLRVWLTPHWSLRPHTGDSVAYYGPSALRLTLLQFNEVYDIALPHCGTRGLLLGNFAMFHAGGATVECRQSGML